MKSEKERKKEKKSGKQFALTLVSRAWRENGNQFYSKREFYLFQVNMMSAQMLAAASSASGTVADLAPGAKDGMRMLEAKAAEMSVELSGSWFCLLTYLRRSETLSYSYCE